MLTIEKTVTPSIEQWQAVIRGMRNPMNSWNKCDSFTVLDDDGSREFYVGENDQKLMETLGKEGQPNRKFFRMLTIYADVTAPLYWWKEYDTYKVGTVANSCSTMHKIHDKEFTLDDFSHEHLLSEGDEEVVYGDWVPLHVLEHVIRVLNAQRSKFLATQNKKYWWQMIQLLPSSYNQKRTIMLNYEVLLQIYEWRRHHKLDEWHTFCDWIESLPCAKLLITKE